MSPDEAKTAIDALDALALALSRHQHAWSEEERSLYERAISPLKETAGVTDEPSTVIEMGPRIGMTPNETLAVASRESWDLVMVIGVPENEGLSLDGFRSYSSTPVTRAEANYLLDLAKTHAMGVLERIQ